MDKAPLKIVLITSGLDHLTTRFHRLPEQPLAIIEIGEWGAKQRLRYFIRRCIRLLRPLRYPDCQQYCKKHGFSFIRVKKSNKIAIKAALQSLAADMAITFKCPLIPMDTISHLPYGAINLHNSVLPDYRGGNPLFWQVINNEDIIGCTVHSVSAELDGGDILEQRQYERPRSTHHIDLNYLATVTHGFPMLSNVITKISAGEMQPQSQSLSDNHHTAPNCDWATWRAICDERGLSDEQRDDIKHFVGEGVKPKTASVTIAD